MTYRLHYAPDNASLVVRLALEELGAGYDTLLVDRRKRAQDGPAYRKLNPAGLIPVLETPDGPIFETGAILLWLADRHDRLMPGPDAPDRGAALKWLFFLSNTLHADMRTMFYPALYVGDDPDHQHALRHAHSQRIAGHLGLLDAAAGETPWLFSADTPTCLSLYLACLMRWCALYPADHDRRWFDTRATPRLHAMLEGLETRASVRAAQAAEGLGPHPFTAPDYANPPEGTAT